MLLTRQQHIQLLKICLRYRLTISWIIRYLCIGYINSNPLHVLKIQRGELGNDPQRFNLCLYGDLLHMKQVALLSGHQLGPLIRFIINEYLEGKYNPDKFRQIKFSMVRNTKRIKEYKSKNWHYIPQQMKTTYHYTFESCHFKESEYWKINYNTLFGLLKMGSQNRKYFRDI